MHVDQGGNFWTLLMKSNTSAGFVHFEFRLPLKENSGSKKINFLDYHSTTAFNPIFYPEAFNCLLLLFKFSFQLVKTLKSKYVPGPLLIR